MKASLGVLLMMGAHKLSQFKDYFSNDPVLAVSYVLAIFTKACFDQLLESIHLVDNQQPPPHDRPHDKLWKLRPFLNDLCNNFRDHFHIGQNVSTDELMVKGNGHNPHKQYMPAKPVKRGPKIWELGCSDCCSSL